MTTDELEDAIHEFGFEVFGADWFDFVDRYNAWVRKNPDRAMRLVEVVAAFVRRPLP